MVQLTFVLIRGLARGNAHWLDFPDRLMNAFPDSKVMCLEIPGNGDRHLEQTPISPMLIIDEFRKSVFSKFNSPLCLIGISLGGMLALKWAETFPEEIHKAYVLNSSLVQLSNPFLRLRPSAYAFVISSLFSRDTKRREKNILELISNLKISDEMIIEKLVEISNRGSTRVSNFFRQLVLANNIRIVRKPPVEVFILTSKNDKMVSFKCSVAIADFLAAKYFVHQTAGHDLALDDADWVIEKLIDNFRHT